MTTRPWGLLFFIKWWMGCKGTVFSGQSHPALCWTENTDRLTFRTPINATGFIHPASTQKSEQQPLPTPPPPPLYFQMLSGWNVVGGGTIWLVVPSIVGDEVEEWWERNVRWPVTGRLYAEGIWRRKESELASVLTFDASARLGLRRLPWSTWNVAMSVRRGVGRGLNFKRERWLCSTGCIGTAEGLEEGCCGKFRVL